MAGILLSCLFLCSAGLAIRVLADSLTRVRLAAAYLKAEIKQAEQPRELRFVMREIGVEPLRRRDGPTIGAIRMPARRPAAFPTELPVAA